MTVKELIERLQEFDESHEVIIDTGDEDLELMHPVNIYEGSMWNVVIE